MKYIQNTFHPSCMISLSRNKAVEETDMVSIMVVGKSEGLYDNIETASEVIVWNAEQEGSPRFQKICQDLVHASLSKPKVKTWKMMVIGEVKFRHKNIQVCPTIFMWDVPQNPFPIENGNSIGSIFLNHGRRTRFTKRIQGKIPEYQIVEGIKPRDPFLAKASVVINIHARETPNAIELHRISRCLSMGCVVLSEGTLETMTKNFLLSSGSPLYFAPEGLSPEKFSEWVVSMLETIGHVDKKKNQEKFYSWFSSLKDHVIVK